MEIENEYIELMQNRKEKSLEQEKKNNSNFVDKLNKIENKFKKKYGININDEVNWFNIIKVIEKVCKDAE